MIGIPQLAIAITALGVIILAMGLFPGFTGRLPADGVGLVQFVVILLGFSIFTLGGLLYVKTAFYWHRASNLAQQISVRLSFTGILLMGMTGLADFLGFGSHAGVTGTPVLLGPLQAVGVMGGVLLSALGVMLYAVLGDPPPEPPIQ